ncbi:MAG: SRPBCC family protein [Pyrinomonadaceae bacterium]
MAYYRFVTVWTFDAPIERVWHYIKRSEDWSRWWRGVVRVVELTPGDADGLGSIRRSTWRSALPYTLEFDSEIVRIEPMRLIEARAFGELDGRGLWQFESLGENLTRVRYDWQVTTTKRWMNLTAPIARPFFKWNHDVIMGRGEEGLRRLLASERAAI